MRDEGKLHGIETEKKLFQTEHPGWKKTASKMVESGVGVDLFIAAASGSYMDVATIGNFSYDFHCPSLMALQVMSRQPPVGRLTFIPTMLLLATARNSDWKSNARLLEKQGTKR